MAGPGLAPITELNTEVVGGAGVAEGLGVALHGSRVSYAELASGFSSTKLPPKPPFPDVPAYRWARGALNIARTKLIERLDSGAAEPRVHKEWLCSQKDH